MAHILILAALPEEADALFPDGGTREDGIFAARRLAAHGHAITVATGGLGKVQASLEAGLPGTGADLLRMSGTWGAFDGEAGRQEGSRGGKECARHFRGRWGARS